MSRNAGQGSRQPIAEGASPFGRFMDQAGKTTGLHFSRVRSWSQCNVIRSWRPCVNHRRESLRIRTGIGQEFSFASGRSPGSPGGWSANFRSASADNGSEMACSSPNHLPRSISLQRLEQKGPNGVANQSPRRLQLGHLIWAALLMPMGELNPAFATGERNPERSPRRRLRTLIRA